MMKKVIEWVRVSTLGQAGEDRASIPAQHTVNSQTARTYGLEIVDCFEIINVSGAAVLRTPEMQRLLKRIEDPEIHGVVVREFSRVMRPDNLGDYVLLQIFEETKTVLYLPEGPLNLNRRVDKAMAVIRAAMAGLERGDILERVWSAKEEKRRAGKCPQSAICLPFGVGYDAKNGKWHYKPEVEKVREAARLFLSGETSYKEVGRRLGIEPFNLRYILRNPIYTGWRIYDKRRDPSSAAIRTRQDGRQGDRPKIARAPEDVIRAKVLEPIISEIDFAQLQQILDLKKLNHWRARPEYQRRFTYSGFLRCAVCGNLIYSHGRRGRSWYVCKSRTAEERKKRRDNGLEDCNNCYMRRERLEENLDTLIGDRLTDRKFLKQLARNYADRESSRLLQKHAPARIEELLVELEQKKQRVLDVYVEGLIDRAERNRRLQALESDIALYGNLAMQAVSSPPLLSVNSLASVLGVFDEWEFLGRANKRRLLQVAMPTIHVKDYRVTGLTLIAEVPGPHEVTHTGRDSWPPPA